MKLSVTVFFLLLLAFENEFLHSNGEKILSLSFFSSRSHKKVYEPLITELANRGHLITVVTPFKASKSHKNIYEIVGKSMEDDPAMQARNMFEMKLRNENSMNPWVLGQFFEDICTSYYNMSEVQDLQNEKFDLIFVGIMNECTYGLVHHLQAPFIIISTVSPMQAISASTGTPSPASFVPFLMSGFSDDMHFFQRVANLVGQTMFQLMLDWTYFPRVEKVYRNVFGEDTPSSSEIQKNVSLILANSHLTMSYPRPLMPDIIEVGGMACRPAKPLPKVTIYTTFSFNVLRINNLIIYKANITIIRDIISKIQVIEDLDEFMTSAGNDGVIYFSMGSILQANTMPESYRKLFLNVFSKLKQKVLWKWETETMADLPKNVKLAKWLPQQDILGHPNTKMFITHGGLGSLVEAVYHGTPLVGMPMFGDQDNNMKQSSQLGFAVTLDFVDLREESLLDAINQILNNPTFTRRAKELSSVYRDRPQNPLETAIYWTEYVMRHKGAKHLRSPARHLNWFEYHSYDAITFVAGVSLVILYLIFSTFKFVTGKCRGLSKTLSSAKKTD